MAVVVLPILGGIGVLMVKIINAIRGVKEVVVQQTEQMREHDVRQEMRTDRLQNTIKGTGDGGDC